MVYRHTPTFRTSTVFGWKKPSMIYHDPRFVRTRSFFQNFSRDEKKYILALRWVQIFRKKKHFDSHCFKIQFNNHNNNETWFLISFIRRQRKKSSDFLCKWRLDRAFTVRIKKPTILIKTHVSDLANFVAAFFWRDFNCREKQLFLSVKTHLFMRWKKKKKKQAHGLTILRRGIDLEWNFFFPFHKFSAKKDLRA